jgi:predicted metal-dependent hydrolase
MTSSSTIEINGVGPVLFERSKRAKHLNISVKPFTGVRVAVPDGMSMKKAEEFVQDRISWIKKHSEIMKKHEKEIQNNAASATEIDPKKAKTKLKRRLRYLADKHGYTYKRVFIRNQRTRWGSCSAKDNISLNIKLINLPSECVDYVILHELAHTKHKNHGNEFWAELKRVVTNWEEARQQLKERGMWLV